MQHRIKMKRFNLKDICRELVTELQNSTSQKSRIKLSLDIQIPDLVDGDPFHLTSPARWLSKWLDSRLINGVIHIDVVRRSKMNDDLVLVVSITGIGMKDVFDRELLSSAHEFALMQQADVRVKSEDDKIIFEFNVPFKNLHDVIIQSPSLLNKCILIAEDSEINALVFSGFMEEWGCEITVVENGQDALDKIFQQSFDLILMDIHMPVMDGNEAIRRIRQQNREIPIIALTASTLESDIKESLENGANDYLLKPVASRTLFSVLQKYLTQPRNLESRAEC